MTNFFIFISFTFLCFNSAVCQNTLFLKKYSSSSELSFNSIIVTHDSNYVVAGETFSPNGGNSFLIKTDRAGNELWRKTNNLWTAFDDSSTSARCILETADHELIICGSLISIISGYNSQFYISKSDSVGNKIWDLIFGGSENEALEKVIQLTDGNFLAIGRKSPPGWGYAFIVKFNSLGDTLWTKKYDFNNNPAEGKDVFQIDNEFVIAGYIYDTLASLDRGFLATIDSVGTMTNYSIINDSINLMAASIKQTGINEIGFLSYNSSTSRSHYGTVILFDTLLQEINRAQIQTGFIYLHVWINDTSFISLFPDVLTMKFNKYGQSLWDYYTYEEYSWPRSAVLEKEGNILICGNVDEDRNTTSQGFILKIDDTTLTTNVISKQIDNKLVYFVTTPSTNETYIHVDKKLFEDSNSLTLILFNNAGAVCDEIELKQPIELLNNERLLTGVYSYRLHCNKNKIITGKILIQSK